MGLIYMATSPSGKSYIGQTTKTLQERIKNHAKAAKQGSSYAFHNAIRKYGIENISFIILEDGVLDVNLNEREKYYIQKYNTYEEGYNLTIGGDGARKIIDDDILKLWEQGYNLREIAAQLETRPNTICNHVRDLLPKTEIQKRRYESVSKKKSLPLEEQNFIYELWKQGCSMTELEKLCGHERHCISKALQKLGITKEQIIQQGHQAAASKRGKPIIQYDKDMNFIAEYPSLSEAARQLQISINNICSALKGRHKTAGGYIFKYKENYDSN